MLRKREQQQYGSARERERERMGGGGERRVLSVSGDKTESEAHAPQKEGIEGGGDGEDYSCLCGPGCTPISVARVPDEGTMKNLNVMIPIKLCWV